MSAAESNAGTWIILNNYLLVGYHGEPKADLFHILGII